MKNKEKMSLKKISTKACSILLLAFAILLLASCQFIPTTNKTDTTTTDNNSDTSTTASKETKEYQTPEFIGFKVSEDVPTRVKSLSSSTRTNEDILSIVQAYLEADGNSLGEEKPSVSSYSLYAKSGDVVYLECWLNNPDQCTIISFMINGIKYQVGGDLTSYFYSDGTNCVFVALTIPNDKYNEISYTISNVQYITPDDSISSGGKSILIGDNDTVYVGLNYQNDAKITLSSSTESLSYNTYSIGYTLTDDSDVIADSSAWVRALVIDENGKVVAQKKILKTENTISFSDLKEGKTYDLAIVMLYDKHDGKGVSLNILNSSSFATKKVISLTATSIYTTLDDGNGGAEIDLSLTMNLDVAIKKAEVLTEEEKVIYNLSESEIETLTSTKKLSISKGILNSNELTVRVYYGDNDAYEEVKTTTPTLDAPLAIIPYEKGGATDGYAFLDLDGDGVWNYEYVGHQFFPLYSSAVYGFILQDSTNSVNIKAINTYIYNADQEYLIFLLERVLTDPTYTLTSDNQKGVDDFKSFYKEKYGKELTFEELEKYKTSEDYQKYISMGSYSTTDNTIIYSGSKDNRKQYYFIIDNWLDIQDAFYNGRSFEGSRSTYFKINLVVDYNDGKGEQTVEIYNSEAYNRYQDMTEYYQMTDNYEYYNYTVDGNTIKFNYNTGSYPQNLTLMANGAIKNSLGVYENILPCVLTNKTSTNAQIFSYQNPYTNPAEIECSKDDTEYKNLKFIEYSWLPSFRSSAKTITYGHKEIAVINETLFDISTNTDLYDFLSQKNEEWLNLYLVAINDESTFTVDEITGPSFYKEYSIDIEVDSSLYPEGTYALIDNYGYTKEMEWYEYNISDIHHTEFLNEEAFWDDLGGYIVISGEDFYMVHDKTPLGDITNIKQDGYKISWDAIENATAYEVLYSSNIYTSEGTIGTTQTTKFTFTDNFFDVSTLNGWADNTNHRYSIRAISEIDTGLTGERDNGFGSTYEVKLYVRDHYNGAYSDEYYYEKVDLLAPILMHPDYTSDYVVDEDNLRINLQRTFGLDGNNVSGMCKNVIYIINDGEEITANVGDLLELVYGDVIKMKLVANELVAYDSAWSTIKIEYPKEVAKLEGNKLVYNDESDIPIYFDKQMVVYQYKLSDETIVNYTGLDYRGREIELLLESNQSIDVRMCTYHIAYSSTGAYNASEWYTLTYTGVLPIYTSSGYGVVTLTYNDDIDSYAYYIRKEAVYNQQYCFQYYNSQDETYFYDKEILTTSESTITVPYGCLISIAAMKDGKIVSDWTPYSTPTYEFSTPTYELTETGILIHFDSNSLSNTVTLNGASSTTDSKNVQIVTLYEGDKVTFCCNATSSINKSATVTYTKPIATTYTGTFTLVNSASDLVAGSKYLIVVAGENKAIGAIDSKGRLGSVGCILDDSGNITSLSSSAILLTLSGDSTGYGFILPSGEYFINSNTGLSTSVNNKWSISFNNEITSIVYSNDYHLLYSVNNGSSFFKAYTSYTINRSITTASGDPLTLNYGTGYLNVSIYKLVED